MRDSKNTEMNSIQVKLGCEEAEGNYLPVIFACTRRVEALCDKACQHGVPQHDSKHREGDLGFTSLKAPSSAINTGRRAPALQGKPMH